MLYKAMLVDYLSVALEFVVNLALGIAKLRLKIALSLLDIAFHFHGAAVVHSILGIVHFIFRAVADLRASITLEITGCLVYGATSLVLLTLGVKIERVMNLALGIAKLRLKPTFDLLHRTFHLRRSAAEHFASFGLNFSGGLLHGTAHLVLTPLGAKIFSLRLL